MTDAEINLAIAKLEHPDAEITQDNYNWGSCALIRSEELALNYVSDWADIGPIIEREKIDLNSCSDYWAASDEWNDGFCEIYAEAETPTKAAALCYLNMSGVSLRSPLQWQQCQLKT